MKTTKNILSTLLNNWMRVPTDNLEVIKTTMKERITSLSHIRASDINVHFGEG